MKPITLSFESSFVHAGLGMATAETEFETRSWLRKGGEFCTLSEFLGRQALFRRLRHDLELA
jgi:hypothetical protein